MQAVIICGGLASRLGNKSKNIPKSLIKIKNKPFLHYQLKYLEKNKIKEVVLCTGYLHNKIIDFINKNKNNYNLKILLSHENTKLGTGGSLRNAENYLRDFFFVMYGDSFLRLDLKKMSKVYKNRNKNFLFSIFKNKNEFYENNIHIKNNTIIEYDKDSKDYMKYIDYGISIFDKKKFLKLSLGKNKFDLSEIIKLIVKKKQISFVLSKDTFFEIGSHKGIKDLKKFLSMTNISHEN